MRGFLTQVNEMPERSRDIWTFLGFSAYVIFDFVLWQQIIARVVVVSIW